VPPERFESLQRKGRITGPKVLGLPVNTRSLFYQKSGIIDHLPRAQTMAEAMPNFEPEPSPHQSNNSSAHLQSTDGNIL
jgi:hypothetical protein